MRKTFTSIPSSRSVSVWDIGRFFMPRTTTLRGDDEQGVKGFTLIELLVVVLIIGILAAVALPQYEKAVIKSRIAGSFANLKTITNAAEGVYLETGTYPTDFTVLPISLPGTLSNWAEYSNNILTSPDGSHYYVLETDNGGQVTVVFTKPRYIQINFFVQGPHKGKIRCRAHVNDKVMNDICQNLGGVLYYNSGSNNENWYWIQ